MPDLAAAFSLPGAGLEAAVSRVIARVEEALAAAVRIVGDLSAAFRGEEQE